MKLCGLREFSFILLKLYRFKCSHQIAVAYCTVAQIAILDVLICPTAIVWFSLGLRARVARRQN